jgi:D-alanyl-D-alanine endopeptidase (penicillin-binding protein 7)
MRATWTGAFALLLALGGFAPAESGAREAGAKSVKTAQAAPSGKAVTKKRKPSASAPKSAARKASSKAPTQTKTSYAAKPVARRPSIGQVIGLHEVDDPLDLRSSVALVVDQRSGATLFAKNAQAVLPIASITKLMTAMVVLDAQLPLDEQLEISEADIDTEKHTSSRLRPGTRLSRSELLNLALMASENRAANALGRHYPGGLEAFVDAMNAKARAIGMDSSSFSEPTGLSSRNVSSALDLSRMVAAAFDYPLIREYSTAPRLMVEAGRRSVGYRNTNRLVDNPEWDIALQKTGYISEAGSCLVMYVNVEGRPMVLVLLDAAGVRSRFGDAQRIRSWLESEGRVAPLRTTDAAQASFGS